ncbi:MAG: prepilin peptidase [Candidatus Marinimicrobia bacterium]|nr:prepilin peptidase [Candidatus Neomarinimicrobiota bacterium]MCF7830174.1 prepilin peptidase [Candidatus Neomarinimicrobiota bacterium]MCF7882092.1 prepilin peptidase [Candidatus Neomarinimicrobiota bacterium]
MSRDILAALAFVLGSILGSFFNVLIYRLPREESVIAPPSKCPHCGHRIRPWENIPILGYFVVRGKCRNCGHRISAQYPLVEMASGLIAALIMWNIGLSWYAVSLVVLFYLLGLATITDFKHQIIPDEITIAGIILGIIFSAFQFPGFDGIVRAVLGGLAGGGSLYLIALFGNWLFQQDSMGGGDIKLAAMFGTFLGWQLTFLGIFLGFCVGAVFGGLYLLLTPRAGSEAKTSESAKNQTTKSETPRSGTILPFGPSLAFGAVLSLFWGHAILDWYLNSFIH